MTRNYSIGTDVESNKSIKKIIRQIKIAVESTIRVIELVENNYQVNSEQCYEKLNHLSHVLDPYFTDENTDICSDVGLDFQNYYIEDGTLYSEEISDNEMLKKKLKLLKQKITFIGNNMPNVRTLTGKDENGQKVYEEVLTEAFTDISISGQKPIVEAYAQFSKLLSDVLSGK